jgi:hypothetical protein
MKFFNELKFSKAKATNKNKLALLGLLVLIIIISLALENKDVPQKKTVSSDKTESQIQHQSSPLPSIGDTVILKFGVNKTWVGVTEKSYDELIKFISAKDEYGVIELLSNGMALEVDNGTSAILVSPAGLGVKEVRLLDGKYAGKLVYVCDEALKK